LDEDTVVDHLLRLPRLHPPVALRCR